MPEHFRALLVLIALATVLFWGASRIGAELVGRVQFERWRTAWFTVTFLAFLSHNFWIFCVLYISFVFLFFRRDKNPLSPYLLLLLALPPLSSKIPGLGVVNYLFTLTPPRALALALLLPAALSLLRRVDVAKPWSLPSDKLLLSYVALTFILDIRGTSLTDAARDVLYALTDILLPYFVASRALSQLHQFRSALFALVLSAGLLSTIGIFEILRHWLLYSALPGALEATAAMGNYLGRVNLVRAVATTGQPIALGFSITVASGIFLYIQSLIKPSGAKRKVWALLIGGLIAPLSRGPWIGAMITLITFLLTGKRATASLVKLSLVLLTFLVLTPFFPGGEKIINLIPFVGTTERENIDYRDRLIDNALIVINRNFWLGSVDYLETPEMRSMIQGQGIIDIVNTYIGVTLDYGVVGLALFLGFFLIILKGLYSTIRSVRTKDTEEIVLGRSLLATWVGIMVTIFTVSSITFIPYIYWTLGGIAVAYLQMMDKQNTLQNVY